ncbi:MAG: sigma-70 family RNA polymerase sigma factor [Clostridia bacterium]|nr:sigma-70 family RNA polymerase sigma factor [Clostridia bacterium]
MSKDKEISILSIGHENETVSMAQQGNMKAFEHLVTLYEGYVYNLCYNVFYNALDAQDATQEIFVKIYKNINSFKFNSQFKTWVYKIAINTCIDEYNRKKKRIFEIFDGEEPETYDIPDKKGKNPEQILEEKELRNDLKDIIKSLPLKYRVCIVLRDMQGLTYEEISDTLKLNINTVKVRVNRGRLKIKDKYLKLDKKRKRNADKDFKLSSKQLAKGGDK